MSTDVTVKRLINGREGRGVNRYMLEEVYFSKTAEQASEYLNPQNARYESATGRWYFNFPDMWYNNLSTNKAIGLRKIDIIAKPLHLMFTVRLTQWTADGFKSWSCSVSYPVPANMPTQELLNGLGHHVTTGFGKGVELAMDAWSEYDYTTGHLILGLTPTLGDMNHYSFTITNMNQDMRTFLGSRFDTLSGEEPPTEQAAGTMAWSFDNIWNRQFAFVHASFVTGTSFNYLGRSGEFYPSPSKMYPASHSSQQFYFEISFDGMHPVKFNDLMFFIDLAYIYYDKDYNGD